MEEITKRSITSLVVKLMGVYVLASSLMWIAYMPSALSNVDVGADDFRQYLSMLIVVGGSISAIVLFFVLGAVIIRKSDMIAEWAVREDEIIGRMNRLSTERILRIILLGIGLFLALSSAPKALSGCFMLMIAFFSRDFARYYFFTSVGNLLTFCASLAIIVQSRRISLWMIRKDEPDSTEIIQEPNGQKREIQ